jgi:hypothetical protein
MNEEDDDSNSGDTQEKNVLASRWEIRRTVSRFAVITGIASTFAVGCFTLILVLAQQRHTSTDLVVFEEYQGGSHVIEHCGKTPEEAKARGCIWDLYEFWPDASKVL